MDDTLVILTTVGQPNACIVDPVPSLGFVDNVSKLWLNMTPICDYLHRNTPQAHALRLPIQIHPVVLEVFCQNLVISPCK